MSMVVMLQSIVRPMVNGYHVVVMLWSFQWSCQWWSCQWSMVVMWWSMVVMSMVNGSHVVVNSGYVLVIVNSSNANGGHINSHGNGGHVISHVNSGNG